MRSPGVPPRSKLEDEVDQFIPFSVFHDREKMKDPIDTYSEIERRWKANVEDDDIPKVKRSIAPARCVLLPVML